jgi:hypothetical protein
MMTGEYNLETLRHMEGRNLDYRKELDRFPTSRSLRGKLLSGIPRLVRPKVLYAHAYPQISGKGKG